MGLSNLMGILGQYRNASAAAPPPTVEQDYAQVAQNAPPDHVASGLAEAFRSNETPPFGEMLSTLFSNSNGQQRSGILNQLLSAVGPSLLASGGLGSLAGLIRGGQTNVTTEQAD